jgi:hypothetical protein
MSAAEIMAELPRMSVRERREIARRLLELEADADALKTADETADQGFAILDQMESDLGLISDRPRGGVGRD